MSVLIIATSIGVRIVYTLATWGIQKRTQAWRKGSKQASEEHI